MRTALSTRITSTSATQPNLPPLFPIADAVRNLDKGGEITWRDDSLLSGVAVDVAREWGKASGFAEIVVVDAEADMPAAGGPGFTLLIRESDGTMEGSGPSPEG